MSGRRFGLAHVWSDWDVRVCRRDVGSWRFGNSVVKVGVTPVLGRSLMTLLFVLFVVLGFAFHFLATFPTGPYVTRIAWGCWLIAALVWAVGRLG